MNNKFDELAKGLAQSVTRREAFRRFGLGLVGALAASLGLGQASGAQPRRGKCAAQLFLGPGVRDAFYTGFCIDPNTCQGGPSSNCPSGAATANTYSVCGGFVGSKGCSF